MNSPCFGELFHALVVAGTRRACALCLGVLISAMAAASAPGQTFTLDTNRSSVTVSGTFLGTPFEEQAPGSLSTVFGGTFVVDLSNGQIQFNGQSLIAPANNGSWEPKADGSPGSESANCGAQASVLLGTGKAALRNAEFNVMSPAIPVSGSQFDANGLIFSFVPGGTSSFSYEVTGLVSASGAQSLSGYGTNAISTTATLAGTNGALTLTIPISTTFYLSLLSENDVILKVDGQLVAVEGGVVTAPALSIAVQGQTATLQWQAPADKLFDVLTSTNLTTWQTNAAGLSSSTGSYTWSGPATSPEEFFRLVDSTTAGGAGGLSRR